MRQILIKEICNEKPNSQALGSFNDAVGSAYNSIDDQLQYAIRPGTDDVELEDFEKRLVNSKKITAFQTKAEKTAVNRFYSKYNKKMKSAGQKQI